MQHVKCWSNVSWAEIKYPRKCVSLKCAQICLHCCEWAFLICLDNPYAWQVWYIKKLIKQYDHYTGAPCAGDKRPLLKCAALSHNIMPQISQVLRQCAMGIVMTVPRGSRWVGSALQWMTSARPPLACRGEEKGAGGGIDGSHTVVTQRLELSAILLSKFTLECAFVSQTFSHRNSNTF